MAACACAIGVLVYMVFFWHNPSEKPAGMTTQVKFTYAAAGQTAQASHTISYSTFERSQLSNITTCSLDIGNPLKHKLGSGAQIGHTARPYYSLTLKLDDKTVFYSTKPFKDNGTTISFTNIPGQVVLVGSNGELDSTDTIVDANATATGRLSCPSK
jgi:hypothetical protein